jgi:hypothetical protein
MTAIMIIQADKTRVAYRVRMYYGKWHVDYFNSANEIFEQSEPMTFRQAVAEGKASGLPDFEREVKG